MDRLITRVSEACSMAAGLAVLADELLAHRLARGRDRRVAAALGVIHADPSAFSVREMAAELGLSARRLRDLFREQVGPGPKRYARVRRFQSVLDHLVGCDDLATLALRCGFADQAHLAREFRAFTGLSASDYRARAPAERNHV